MSATLQVQKRRSWSTVHDDVITLQSLSDRGCRVLSWLLGRPDGWETRGAHVQQVFGLSERQWSRMRRELEALGFFRRYRLVFLLIKYEGRHTDYGTRGWPTRAFRAGGEVTAASSDEPVCPPGSLPEGAEPEAL